MFRPLVKIIFNGLFLVLEFVTETFRLFFAPAILSYGDSGTCNLKSFHHVNFIIRPIKERELISTCLCSTGTF